MAHSDHRQSPLPVIAHASCWRGGTILLRTAGNTFRGNATEAKVVDAEQAGFPQLHGHGTIRPREVFVLAEQRFPSWRASALTHRQFAAHRDVVRALPA